MNHYSDRQNYRDLIGLAIEKTLSEISFPLLETVQIRLEEDYNCEFSDCLDHPEYLNKILRDIYGKSYYAIVTSIQKNLKEFESKQLVQNFLTVLQK